LGHVLVGYDGVRLEEYLEVVNLEALNLEAVNLDAVVWMQSIWKWSMGGMLDAETLCIDYLANNHGNDTR
jgi:hypothetical protein